MLRKSVYNYRIDGEIAENHAILVNLTASIVSFQAFRNQRTTPSLNTLTLGLLVLLLLTQVTVTTATGCQLVTELLS